jgi:hypothetical protein
MTWVIRRGTKIDAADILCFTFLTKANIWSCFQDLLHLFFSLEGEVRNKV